MKIDLVLLMKKIGYQFNDNQLLNLALTHRSVCATNNERLEFLGDAIVNLIIAKTLFSKYQHAKEGELSRLRSSLVSRDALAEIGKEFSLGDYVRLGRGELKSGGHKRDSILSCTVEALIGAIYLDSDYATCEQVIVNWYDSRLEDLSLDLSYKDAKTELQELLQSQRKELPKYTLVKTIGKAHEQIFVMKCEIKELNIAVSAEGSSRRKAEKNAAQVALSEISHGK